jgi:hypothetical protein
MRVIGAVLIIAGILAFAMGGFKLTRKEKVADIGPLEISQTKSERVVVPPLAAGAAVVAGIALLAFGARRRA